MGKVSLDRRRGASVLVLVALVVAFGLARATKSEATATAASGVSTSEVVAKAEKFVAPYLQAPKSIPVTVPLRKAPPQHKTIIALANNVTPGSIAFPLQVRQAASLLGWTTKTVYYSPTPEDEVNQMTAAVKQHPAAIIEAFLPPDAYKPAAQLAAQAHVPIIAVAADGGEQGPLVATVAGDQSFMALGKQTANFFIAESKGTGHALTVSYAATKLSLAIDRMTDSTIKADCPHCSAQDIAVPITSTGTSLPSMIVADLQRNPSINYVIFQDTSMFTGVETALQEAGLQSKVKLIANDSTAESIAAVQDGQMLGFNAYSLKAFAYLAVDAAARYVTGMSTKPSYEAPLANQIFTRKTLPAGTTIQNTEQLPANMVQQYERLWKVK